MSICKTPLDVNQVYTIASGVITSCPESNAALLPPTIAAFPALTFPKDTRPGSKVHFEIAHPKEKTEGQYFAAFISGLDTIFVPLDGNKDSVTIPKELYGVVFAVITTDGTKVDDSVTVAGPAFLNFDFDSRSKLERLAM